MEDIFLLFCALTSQQYLGKYFMDSIHCVVHTERLAEMMYVSVMGSRLGRLGWVRVRNKIRYLA
jgi:hypothetical protein